METLIIKGSEHTPEVSFDALNATLKISGESRPENAEKFFNPMTKWLDDYRMWLEEQKKRNVIPGKIVVIFKLDYFNSTSAKYLFDIFKFLNVIYIAGFDMVIEWHYNRLDEDILDTGKVFTNRNMISVPAEFIPFD